MKRILYFSFLIAIIACSSSDKAPMNDVKSDYREKHRLQFHFSPEAYWMNDPNGMVYYDGEYHLFYQYTPEILVPGPLYWGHAVSQDLISWEHLNIGLEPDSLGYIYSGSAVVDMKNTSGLGTKDNPPLIAIFTNHSTQLEKSDPLHCETQGIAFSTDRGRTWKKYHNNPVITNPGIRDFRDPKVFWMSTRSKWIMALAAKDRIHFYASDNLIQWEFLSDFGSDIGAHGGVWECPDLFPLGDQWVLLVSINPGGPNGGSATQYFVGDFDGKNFKPQDDKIRWLDYGRDNYAGVTWSDISDQDGRRIFIGWMSNWDYGTVVPTEKWRSAMTLPRELVLEKDSSGFIVASRIVKEAEKIRGAKVAIEKTSGTTFELNKDNWTTYDLELEIEADEISLGSFEIQLTNDAGDELKVGYLKEEKIFYINRDKSGINDFSEKFNGLQTAPFSISANTLSLRLLVDVGSVEIFVDNGRLTMTSLFFPQLPLHSARLVSNSSMSVHGEIHEMKRIWD